MNNVLSHPETWALLLGLVTPLATAVVQQPTWPKPLRTAVAVLAALVVGTITVLANGNFNTADWFTTVAVCLVAAQTAYHAIWKPAGVARVIELATARRRKDEQYKSAA